jgi:Mg2+-importing ATPase
MPGLLRFTAIMGPLSSLFDIATFILLIKVFHVSVAEFRAAWFIESMATQILVIFAIRTAGRCWRSRPHPALVVSSLACLAVAIVIPFLPLAGAFGFAPPTGVLMGGIALLVVIYFMLAEGLKGFAIPGRQRFSKA